ncbi:hypothetical protein DFH06DRAFT_1125303 [Mycena polygramma]|nr:hypothetical protein DFH06DRAFT_1125303 [Mycena polygramma]
MDDAPGPPGSKSNPYVLVPAPPGTKFNPFLLPDSPLKPRVFSRPAGRVKKARATDENTGADEDWQRRFLGRVSSAMARVPFILARMSAADMRALENRIAELEIGVGTSSASSSARVAENIAQNNRTLTLAHPRPRHAILALEASLLELRTARSSGSTPGGRVPLGNDENAGFGRAQRRKRARRGPAGRVTRAMTANQALSRGSRHQRREPLTQGSLWSGGIAPPDQDANREHHKCGICHMVKSHPVSSLLPTLMSRRGRHLFKNVVDLDEADDPVAPQTVAADRGVYFSVDGLRRNEELLNISHKKRRLNPTQLDDALAEWVPVPDDDFSEEGARLRPEVPTVPTVDSQATVTVLGKRKEYISTVRVNAMT